MNTFLTNLSVPLTLQQMPPCLQSFPPAFNPYGASVWALVLPKVDDTLTVEAQWDEAIQLYLDLCGTSGIMPFREQTDDNTALLALLTKCRDDLLAVLASMPYPLVEQYSVLTLERKALVSAEGFDLKVTSTFKNDDPTFGQALLLHGFMPAGGTLVRRINECSSITVKSLPILRNRWEVVYFIRGPQIPVLPKMLASKEQIETFLIECLWRPLTKDANPSHQGPRFI